MAELHDSESFASILEGNLCATTSGFMSMYRDGIAQSVNPSGALTRFNVEYLSINKTRGSFEHEYMSVVVKDKETDKRYDFFIERQSSRTPAAPVAPAPAAPATDCSNLAFTDSLRSASIDSPSAEYPDSIPLLKISDDTQTSSHSFPPPSPRPQAKRAASPYTLGQRLSLGSTKLLDQSTSSSRVCTADDRILGEGMYINNVGPGLGKLVYEADPYNLSLFELGILAHVVHCVAPNYKIFANQCYWFAKTIFDVVDLLYKKPVQSDAAQVDFLPPVAGHWKKILIVGKDSEETERIIDKYYHLRDEEFSKVSFY
jgi:hypothetical protein